MSRKLRQNIKSYKEQNFDTIICQNLNNENGIRTVENGKKQLLTSFNKLIIDFEMDNKSKNITEKTNNQYVKMVKNFFSYCMENNILWYEDITIFTLTNYIILKTKTVSPENARRFIRYYSVFCNAMKKYHPTLNFDMLKDIKKPQIRKKEKFAYTDEDINEIFSIIEKDENNFFNFRMKTIISIMLKTGMRSNECLNLKVSDLIFEENKFFVAKGKMNKQRVIPMPETIKPLLQEYLFFRNDCPQIIENDYLFLDKNNNPLTYNGIRTWAAKHIKPFLKLSSNRKWGFHQFRVKFATEYYRKTKDIKTLKYLMGHEEIAMTMSYVAIVDVDFLCENPIDVNTIRL